MATTPLGVQAMEAASGEPQTPMAPGVGSSGLPWCSERGACGKLSGSWRGFAGRLAGGWREAGGERNGPWVRLGGGLRVSAAPHNGSVAKKDLYNHNPVMAPRPQARLPPTTSPFPRRRGLLSVEFTLALTSGAWRRVRVGCVECAGASKWACLSPRGAGTAKTPHLCRVWVVRV